MLTPLLCQVIQAFFEHTQHCFSQFYRVFLAFLPESCSAVHHKWAKWFFCFLNTARSVLIPPAPQAIRAFCSQTQPCNTQLKQLIPSL